MPTYDENNNPILSATEPVEKTQQQIQEELPAGLEFTNYTLHMNNRIFSREVPTYGLPNLGYSWMYDYNQVSPEQFTIKKSDLSQKSTEEYVIETGDILNKIFSNYPNVRKPEEKADDLKLESSVINLLDQNRGFASALMLTLNNEGGYAVDDRGGQTKFGISKKYNSDLDIPNITINDAIRRYYSSYWTQNNTLDKLVYTPLQIAHFDDTVLAGIGGANVIMKNFIFNAFGEDDFDDGISIMNNYIKYASREQLYELYEGYAKERRTYYKGRPNSEKYQKGWMNRINKTLEFINTYYMNSWEL